MNALLVLCFAVLAVAVVGAEKPEYVMACIKQFNLTRDDMRNMQETKEPTENMKCFAKCVIDGSGVFAADGTVDVEKLVASIPARDKDEAKVRATAEKCKSLYKANSTCEDAHLAFKCAMSNE